MSDSIFEDIEGVTNGSKAKIKVFGVGGGGGNAVQKMIDSNLIGVQFLAANTDSQALATNHASIKVQLGEKLTRGLGAGSDPGKGREAAVESAEAIKEAIGDADMVFITAGMGGGTGTGAAPVIAQIAKEKGALTVGVVTKPFGFEGFPKQEIAAKGISELSATVDSLIIIPNDRLLSIAPKNTRMLDLYHFADNILFEAVRGISDVIMRTGLMNVDFNDVRTLMQETGLALMGTGRASGESRAREATLAAIKSPLLEDVSLETAKSILCNITCNSDITGEEFAEIGYLIQEAAMHNPTIKYGLVFDENMGQDILVTVIATGIEPVAPVEEELELPREGKSKTFPFPQQVEQPRQSQPKQQPRQQPSIIYENPPQEEAYQIPRRMSKAELYEQKLSQVAYGQPRNFGNAGQSGYAPGKEAYVLRDDEFDTPTFLRNNVD